MIGQPLRTLPRLTVNLFSGGKHAGGQVPIQDVLLVPLAAKSIDSGEAEGRLDRLIAVSCATDAD